MTQQLALAIQLNDDATLADFLWDSNVLLQQQIYAALAQKGDRLFTIWGNSGCGKSHLLQACCQDINHLASAIYLPLQILKDLDPACLEDIGEQELIAIDDIDAIAGNLDWEQKIFHLYNKVRDNETTILLIASKYSVPTLPLKLPDLRSRLAWGLVSQLHQLNDDLKIQVLCQHADKRGFKLSAKVAQFLLNRCTRNLHDLNIIINKLDAASLAAQRKITIPFVKEILFL